MPSKTSRKALEQDIARVSQAPSVSTTHSVARTAEQADYERRSLREAQAHMERIRREPLAARKEAQQAFLSAMRDQPNLVAERLGWLFDGNYGYGEMQIARQILNRPRMNRAAALSQLIGLLEWQCPEDFARAAWKQLSAPQQRRFDQAIEGVIRDAEKDLASA